MPAHAASSRPRGPTPICGSRRQSATYRASSPTPPNEVGAPPVLQSLTESVESRYGRHSSAMDDLSVRAERRDAKPRVRPPIAGRPEIVEIPARRRSSDLGGSERFDGRWRVALLHPASSPKRMTVDSGTATAASALGVVPASRARSPANSASPVGNPSRRPATTTPCLVKDTEVDLLAAVRAADEGARAPLRGL